jgi:polyisoprenoid-binding protein YceI
MIRFLLPALCALVGPASLVAADYTIDAEHSTAAFAISHLAVSTTRGRFNDVSGVISYDASDATRNAVKVEIKTASVDTGNQKRDEHLRKADFFDVATHPTMSFVSRSWKATGGSTYEVAGDFTLHGTTKPLTITVTKTGAATDPWGNERIGFETAFTIKRSDYGMTGSRPMVGDSVAITFATEGIKAK